MTTTSGENQAAESGIDLAAALDPQVRPQDDFFRAINGRWLDEFEIPEDKARYASFTALHDVAEEQLHEIITELSDGVDLTALDADGNHKTRQPKLPSSLPTSWILIGSMRQGPRRSRHCLIESRASNRPRISPRLWRV